MALNPHPQATTTPAGSGGKRGFRKKQYGAGFIVVDMTGQHVLLIRDMRSGKYSLPKGRREEFDVSPIANAIRELYEETGYVLERDYSCVNFEGMVDTYSIFSAVSYGFTRYFTCMPSEYIADVRWVHASQLHKYSLNWITRTALKSVGFY